VNGLTLLALIALSIGGVIAWRAGVRQGRRAARMDAAWRATLPTPSAPPPPPSPSASPPAPVPVPVEREDPLAAERFRLVLAYEDEMAALRRALASSRGEAAHLRVLDDQRHALHRALASSREETARYRQIVVDLENDAPPPLLDGPGAPDDLKLIVGVGPVLERMLQQLGITSYRQIARWTERDIQEFDAKLPEFHGRIRRDEWVKQARALHQSKYGEPPSAPRG
jgi:predicted flap endonuclease-1-like 5' DNA nuclease